ncbi:malate dehydrogenase [Dictyobacter aurantiacus]|uniref:Malate dehydrogenase n=1 Tax=Dictyobacter aurantiacus TaxID=1936993 RepID=A0A401ZEN6_9CHLR|nr:malate dehydrogenase [Dictyobacter aurantiacus]GCE05334.1 malate dehydrogenase [Dictyobacter aurantiacus]
MRSKITVVGAGFVGSTLVQRIAERDYADVVMFDIVPNMPQGKALDMLQAGPVLGYDTLITGTNDYADTADSDVVVITSGFPRKPGMSRDDLLKKNQEIVTQVTEQVVKYSPNAILIMVTNPLDAMAQVALKVSGFPRERVIGMAGVLDTARFRTFIAQELGASVRDVQAYVLGGHGDTMVPLSRLCTVAGVPIAELLPAERIEQIVQRTRDGGAEIVKLLGNGSAYFAPSASVLQMLDSIILDKKMIMPCAIYLQGEYGLNNLFVGVPAKLGAKGLEQVIEVELQEQEKAQLQKSADAVKELVNVLGL